MSRLLAFDLDGTLIQSEALKATSYAWAAEQLRPGIDREAVETAYGHLVGHSREEITCSLLETFGLAPEARAYAEAAGASGEAPWRTYVGIRLEHYRDMLCDVDLVRANVWTEAVGVLEGARGLAERVALVTTSERWAVDLVLTAMNWEDAFDTVVTADDVPAVKPDPTGYRLALDRLDADPMRTLAIEDSPSGLRAALAAGIRPLAVPTVYTRGRIGEMVRSGELDASAVTEPGALLGAARQRLRA